VYWLSDTPDSSVTQSDVDAVDKLTLCSGSTDDVTETIWYKQMKEITTTLQATVDDGVSVGSEVRILFKHVV